MSAATVKLKALTTSCIWLAASCSGITSVDCITKLYKMMLVISNLIGLFYVSGAM